MKKNLLPLLLLTAAGLCNACTQDDREPSGAQPEKAPRLSVAEAQAFFEKNAIGTRSGEEASFLPFVMGETVLHWEEAEASVSDRLSSVDIPAEGEYTYRVLRAGADGTPYEVTAWSKIIVVKSHLTDSLATYIRVSIPDEEYAGCYDGNICNMTLNCEDRVDYCGLEYYAALDGYPVAVARYTDGKCVGSVYLFDETLSREQIGRRYAALFHDMWIFRESNTSGARTRADGEWDYGRPNSVFVDSNGSIYVYVDTDDDGKSDAVTQIFLPFGPGGASGPISSGGGWGGTDKNNNDNNKSEGGEPEPGGTGGSGSNSGGTSGGNRGNNRSDTPVDINGNPIKPDVPKNNLKLNPPRKLVDPTPWRPNVPIVWPGGDSEDPENTEKTEPCQDNAANEANPLLEMEISTDNASWKSNTWGFVRNQGTRFHDGLDLKGEAGVTPVYAMYGGKVVRVVSEQPNRISPSKYPAGYNGDMDNAGNRITIETKLPNGKTIQVSYWHLDIKAKNPYTQKFKYGSTVVQGEIIGIVGNTGNAFGKMPHLHLKTYVLGTDKRFNLDNNPYKYLYTKFDMNNGTVTRDC